MTDHRMLLRGAQYTTLIYERLVGTTLWVRTSRSFVADWPGLCGECGYPILPGQVIARGESVDLNLIRYVHEICPSWEERYRELFAVDFVAGCLHSRDIAADGRFLFVLHPLVKPDPPRLTVVTNWEARTAR